MVYMKEKEIGIIPLWQCLNQLHIIYSLYDDIYNNLQDMKTHMKKICTIILGVTQLLGSSNTSEELHAHAHMRVRA